MQNSFFAMYLWQSGGGFNGLALLPMVLIFVIFYLLIMLPQQKRQKK